MNRRHHGRVDETAVGQRQEVEAVVHDVEVGGALEHGRNVNALGNLRLDGRVLGPTPGDGTDEFGVGDRVGDREERHVVTELDQSFGEKRGEELPRAVVTGRRTPGDRRENSDSQVRAGRVVRV